MKKVLLSVLLGLSFIAAPVFSIEWGGVFKDDTSAAVADFSKAASTKAFDITQSNSLYMWLNSSLSEKGNWYLSSEALYKYKLALSGDSKTFTNIADIDLFKVTGQVPTSLSVLNFAIGRFFVLDNSASVFAQTCDGVSMKASFPVLDVALYAGYTGLLNGLNVTMLDETGYAAAAHGTTTQLYSLSHSYIPLVASVEIPAFARTQTLGIQGSGFIDLNSTTKYNRYYANFMLKGPIIDNIFYTFNTTFGFPNFKSLSNMTDFTVEAYGLYRLAAYFEVKYASGNNGFLKSFRGFTSNPAYNGYSQPELSGVLIPGMKLIYSTSLANLTANASCVLTCPEDALSVGGVDGGLGAYFNVFSDLQLSINLQAYLDLSSNTKDEEGNKTAGDSYYKLSIGAAFAF